MLGFKTAVLEGELRVIHLLFWAGLWERVDVHTIVWVLHNTGRNRLNVALEVLRLWIEKRSTNLQDQLLLEMILNEFKEKVTAELDERMITFVDSVLQGIGMEA
jgi:hypothetical protein